MSSIHKTLSTDNHLTPVGSDATLIAGECIGEWLRCAIERRITHFNDCRRTFGLMQSISRQSHAADAVEQLR